MGDLVGVGQRTPGVVDEQVQDRGLTRERGHDVPELRGDATGEGLAVDRTREDQGLAHLLHAGLLSGLLSGLRLLELLLLTLLLSELLEQLLEGLLLAEVGELLLDLRRQLLLPITLLALPVPLLALPVLLLAGGLRRRGAGALLLALLALLLSVALLTHLRGGAHAGVTFPCDSVH
ncbi:hypothetical protein GCM10009612_40840 [Streptomyces beijiangensis]